MPIDFSIIENIDFTNADNLIFLSIIFILAVIIFFIFIFIVFKIIKIIKRMIVRLFNIDVRKSKLDQKKNIDWLHQSQNNNISKQKIIGSNSTKNVKAEEKPEEKREAEAKSYKEKEEKSISEGLSKLKTEGGGEEALESKMPSRVENQEVDEHQEIKIPRVKTFQGAVSAPNIKAEEKPEEKREAEAKSYKEKEEKSISEGLSKLKTEGGGEEALESKMPSRVENQEEGGVLGRINIPVAKRFSSSSSQQIGPMETKDGRNIISASPIPEALVSKKEIKNTDSSVFGGKEEISRISLRHKLRYDPKIWEAQRDLRMNLSPMERVKLEKETFAPVYGRNISKKDLKLNIKRLGREWASTTDMKRKELLRKEIKFFKKIGVIKD